MIGVGKGASHLNLNSGTCKTCGTGETDDCLNLTGGACENPAMLNSANCSNLLSYASHLSYASQRCEALFILISLYSLLTEGQNLLFAVAQCTVERRSRVILQGTAACPP